MLRSDRSIGRRANASRAALYPATLLALRGRLSGMEFRDLIRRRRMVRKFEQRRIPDEVLRRVLEPARHAPSGGFSQGFDFIVLTKPEELA